MFQVNGLIKAHPSIHSFSKALILSGVTGGRSLQETGYSLAQSHDPNDAQKADRSRKNPLEERVDFHMAALFIYGIGSARSAITQMLKRGLEKTGRFTMKRYFMEHSQVLANTNNQIREGKWFMILNRIQ